MFDLSTRTALPAVRATSKRLGVDLPPGLLKDLANTDKLRDAKRAFADGPDPTAAVAAAISAGKDPLVDKAVQRAALAHQLSELNMGFRLALHADALDVGYLRQHADSIIDTWRPVVERANKAVAAFRAQAPGVNVLDDSLPQGLPVKALTPWGEAKEVALLIEQLGKGWQSLAGACGVNMPPGTRPLIVADLSLEQIENLGHNAGAHAAVGLADQLELADMETFSQRTQRIQSERQSRQDYVDAAPERAREERRKNGWGAAIRIPGGMVQIP